MNDIRDELNLAANLSKKARPPHFDHRGNKAHPLGPLSETPSPVIKLLREHAMTPRHLGHIRSLLETLLYDPRLRRPRPSTVVIRQWNDIKTLGLACPPPLSVSKLVSKSPLIATSHMQGSTPTKSPNHENVGDFYRLPCSGQVHLYNALRGLQYGPLLDDSLGR
ncbi:hypothetical protein IWY39_001200 [Sphingobium sp. JAI105]|uniref:hypothetical protein n=1 Tax=Sphingobium sp. JAI105 TaxID=2787715 RepID=UPI001A22CFE8|nr:MULTISPECIES: hypothetical protein [unclassified Sphingobium]MBG6117396.1 hypothetical protein [Sphingobium sp. JAI105]